MRHIDPAVVGAFSLMIVGVILIAVGAIMNCRSYSRNLDEMTRLTQGSMRDTGRYMFPEGKEKG